MLTNPTFKFYWAVHPNWVTAEREKNGQHLPFLDLNVHRTIEEKLGTNIIAYTHAHKLKYLSYDSHQLIATEFIKSVAKKLLGSKTRIIALTVIPKLMNVNMH
jgi:hypothetical protein